MAAGHASAQHRLTRPVFFIGFMGCGKTSVSRYLAETAGAESIDADEYLESREGRAIVDIFAEDGEEHFRDLETECLKDLADGGPRLIGCGGGVVKRPENVAIMHDKGFVVYLEVSAQAASRRIPNADTRPLFENLETARKMLSERSALYERAADVRVPTVGRAVPEISEEVRAILVERGILAAEPR